MRWHPMDEFAPMEQSIKPFGVVKKNYLSYATT
jgi:hypothetical protein